MFDLEIFFERTVHNFPLAQSVVYCYWPNEFVAPERLNLHLETCDIKLCQGIMLEVLL